ncbi:hypothetical protein [Streptomyces sp. NBC_00829]|uniref:hypothetical protein n=1 Tax=Streptomyces sp. NBC_00829 TaxID=2903679 RepID=UPI003866453C|nr:hypothetical protein OG293_40170 [Streptomyces sp. NBC_00829]
MNRAFCTLASAIAFSALTIGTAAAAPTVNPGNADHVPAASNPAGFVNPGPDMVVKRSVPIDETTPVNEATAKGEQRSAAGKWVKITDKKYQGQKCGTGLLQQTSGRGKTTLVMTVSKSVSTEWKSEAKIDASVVSAGIGFSVTKSYTVENQTRYEVPKGKFGTVQAYPLYDLYTFNAKILDMKKSGWAMKPVGVCFNQWTE